LPQRWPASSVAPADRLRDFEDPVPAARLQGLLDGAGGLDMALGGAGQPVGQPVATLLGAEPVALRAYDSLAWSTR